LCINPTLYPRFLSAIVEVGPSTIKAAIAFYQIVMSFPTSFAIDPVTIPFDFNIAMTMFDFVNIDWTEMVYPVGCLAGGYIARLSMVALFPLGLIIVLPVVTMAVIVLSNVLFSTGSLDEIASVETWTDSLSGTSTGTPSQTKRWGTVHLSISARRSRMSSFMQAVAKIQKPIPQLHKHMLRVLPLATFVIFLFLPAVTRSIFFTWVCTRYDEGNGNVVSYLRKDPTTVCGDSYHNALVGYANFLILLWPIGLNLLLFAAIWRNRKSLQEGRVTPYTAAVKFLTGGYKPKYFYCEQTAQCFETPRCTT
jgi:hypothetical protein